MKALVITTLALVATTLPAFAGGLSGEAAWMKHCKKCHGADGAGKTPMGKMFKLVDFSDPGNQAELTDAAVRTAILDGMKNASGKQVMLPFAKKLSEEEVDDLVAHFRSLAE